jgi:hypothetical protein
MISFYSRCSIFFHPSLSIIEAATGIASTTDGARDAEKKHQTKWERKNGKKDEAKKAANVGLTLNRTLENICDLNQINR